MRVTLRAVKSVYSLLRSTKPFCDWGLPPANRIKFTISDDRIYFGEAWVDTGFPTEIIISRSKNKTLLLLIRTMGHEMCHVHEMRSAARSGVELPDKHDTIEFIRLRNEVVKHNPSLFLKGDF